MEFIAYRLLYSLYTGSSSDARTRLQRLSPSQRAHPWVRHSLSVLAAAGCEDWARYFKLYLSAPNMAGYLMEWTAHTSRIKALQVLTKSIKPSLPLPWLTSLLAFDSQREAHKFISGCGGVWIEKMVERTEAEGNKKATTKTKKQPSKASKDGAASTSAASAGLTSSSSSSSASAAGNAPELVVVDVDDSAAAASASAAPASAAALGVADDTSSTPAISAGFAGDSEQVADADAGAGAGSSAPDDDGDATIAIDGSNDDDDDEEEQEEAVAALSTTVRELHLDCKTSEIVMVREATAEEEEFAAAGLSVLDQLRMATETAGSASAKFGTSGVASAAGGAM